MEFAEVLFEERSPEDNANSLLESARGGTLYLSGVEELPYPLQGTLQRFLVERESARSSTGRPAASTEVRIIAGSGRDLRTLSSLGQFRSELYSKLAALEIRVPALHERTDDLPMLAEWLLARASRRTGLPAKVLSGSALESLQAREFGQNLREFEQAILHASALAEGNVIEAAHVPPPQRSASPAPTMVSSPQPEVATGERLHDVIQRHVLQILTRCRGNKLRAAEALGISRSTLYRMLDTGSFAPETSKRGG
jgi:DNA-binding NtrC family response regulator